jgi:hypothetical protein
VSPDEPSHVEDSPLANEPVESANSTDVEAASDEVAVSKKNSPSLITHVVWFFIAVLVVLASVVLTVNQSEVGIPGLSAVLPGLCTFKRTTGLDCPGCGLTRCFISLGHGQIGAAFGFNPVGILLYVFVIIQIPFRLTQIVRIRWGRRELKWHDFGTWAVMAIAFLLIGQWVIRSLIGSFLWS